MSKIRNLIGVCSLMILFLCGCNSDNDIQGRLPEGTIGVRLIASGMAEGETSDAECRVNEVEGFRFEEGVLEEIFDRLNPDSEGTCHLQPLQMRGTVYFLANAGEIIRKAALQVGQTTLEEFLDLQATVDELTASGMVMTGRVELDREMISATVAMKRCVSRIDLDSSFEGVKVNNLKIKNIVPSGYVNERQEAQSPEEIDPTELMKDFGEEPFENRKETLFYVCEQGGRQYDVELMVTTADGAWHRLKTSFSAIKRNTIYTLKVYGNGADARVEVMTDDWENGISSESGQLLKGLIDKNASELSEGVEINERGDTVFVPYQESDFQLSLLAEEGTRLIVDGMAEGVNVVPQVAARGLQQLAKVSVSSSRKMPGSVQEYIYLDVYKQNVCTGRVVLVFRPNPIKLTGKIRFDGNAVCDFNTYIDGELGILTLPEGKVLKTEIAGTAPWMKVEAGETAGTYRIIAGWKPNDPDADGRVQEARLLIADADGSRQETYTIKRQNWGLPVVNINGTWWCKYNLRGNVKNFSDQILIKNDPVSEESKVFEYLKTCSDEDLLKAMGDQYQAGNQDGLKLTHEGDTFYYEGYQGTSGNFGTMDPTEMAPDGYQIPNYNNYRFFTWNENCNLGYNTWGVFNNGLGQRMNFSVAERTLVVDGVEYGTIGLYDFVYNNTHWTIFGLGHQWADKSISNMMVLLATYGNVNNTWLIEGYPKSDGRGNWFKYSNNNAQKTRTIRCVKTPVEYIYE